jgi:glutamyl-tRNA reductase
VGDATLGPNSVLRFLAAHYDLKLCEWRKFYRLLDEQALGHAFAVSCELDSRYVGEGQIARQVNAAWQQAREAGSTGRFLDAVLRKALAVRSRVRRETAIATEIISVPRAALDLAHETLGSLASQRVLLLGAGKMCEILARSLVDHGTGAVEVISRRHEQSVQLAERAGIKAFGYEEIWDRMIAADLVISATSSAHCVLRMDEMMRVASLRGGRKLVLIDLALPRDVDPGVRSIEGLLLYDLDDLERVITPANNHRESEAAAQRIIVEEVRRFRKEMVNEQASPTIVALRHRLDEIFREELDAFRQERGPFPKDQDQMIAALGARLTHRIAGSLSREIKA